MKQTLFSILVAGVLIGGSILLTTKQSSGDSASASVDNVSVVDGTQIIALTAKGGYSPRITKAKADMPTVLKVNTKGTFDCSSSIAIPSLGYRGNLPLSGATDIPIPPQKSGTTIRGLCGMGMYDFSINFES